MKCRFCKGDISIFLDLSDIPLSVTSDLRVVNIGVKVFRCDHCGLLQKYSSEKIQNEYFNEFYSQPLTDGDEQIKFIGNTPYPRSELIIKKIEKYMQERGQILDIGTGSGVFLKSYQKFFPKWKLFAQDIQENSINHLLKLMPKENFYLGDIKNIKDRFELISIIGVLGHIPNLLTFLEELHKISNDSKIVIQTPDIQKNFFDVVIIDHITFFSKSMLYKILSQYFVDISFFDVVNKEITTAINFKEKKEEFDCEKEEKDILTQAKRFKNFVTYLFHSKESFVVLGSAPVSTYIGAILKNRLICFVDEDKSKQGKTHLNTFIKDFASINKNDVIILPFLQEEIVCEIKKRHCAYKFISFEDIDNYEK